MITLYSRLSFHTILLAGLSMDYLAFAMYFMPSLLAADRGRVPGEGSEPCMALPFKCTLCPPLCAADRGRVPGKGSESGSTPRGYLSVHFTQLQPGRI